MKNIDNLKYCLFVCWFLFFFSLLLAIDMSKSFISFALTEITRMDVRNCSLANKHGKYVCTNTFAFSFIFEFSFGVRVYIYIPFTQLRGDGGRGPFDKWC